VTAVNADGSANADSAATAVVTSPAAAPKNTERPTISGTARVGQTLTANPGSWSGNPDAFSYQWQRCDADGSNCGDIAGMRASKPGPNNWATPAKGQHKNAKAARCLAVTPPA
jgi:hypothetical protein